MDENTPVRFQIGPPTQTEWDDMQTSLDSIDANVLQIVNNTAGLPSGSGFVTYSIPYTTTGGVGVTTDVRVYHSTTLGDLMVSGVLVLFLVAQVFRVTFNAIRGGQL